MGKGSFESGVDIAWENSPKGLIEIHWENGGGISRLCPDLG